LARTGRATVTSSATKTVERGIYFYRVDAGQDIGGNPLPFDAEGVLRFVGKLPKSNAHRWTSQDGIAYGCWVDDDSRLRFGLYRNTALPHVEHAGVLSPLTEPEIVETIHVVFFPDRIVGSDFNFNGPRMARLGQYLSDVAKSICNPVSFRPLLRHDVINQLDRLSELRLLRLRIRASYAVTVHQADTSLGTAFMAAREAGNAEEVEIVLKPQAYSHGWISRNLMSPLRRLAQRDDMHDNVLRFDVKGLDSKSQRIQVVDMLSDQLIVKKKIVLHDGHTRSLDRESAYEAIEEGYAELEDELVSATEILL
jgi:hypothetical protein